MPRCFASPQQWEAYAALCGPHVARTKCNDCSPAYQRRMALAGRCEHGFLLRWRWDDAAECLMPVLPQAENSTAQDAREAA